MAREVKAFGCDFKCGQKVVLSKKTMEEHESRCFSNPSRRACKTCKFFEMELDGNGMEGTQYNHEWINFICHGNDDIELTQEALRADCEFYKQKSTT